MLPSVMIPNPVVQGARRLVRMARLVRRRGSVPDEKQLSGSDAGAIR